MSLKGAVAIGVAVGVTLGIMFGVALSLWLFAPDVTDLATLPLRSAPVQTVAPLEVVIENQVIALPAGTPLLEQQLSPEGVSWLALRFRYVPAEDDSVSALVAADSAAWGRARPIGR